MALTGVVCEAFPPFAPQQWQFPPPAAPRPDTRGASAARPGGTGSLSRFVHSVEELGVGQCGAVGVW